MTNEELYERITNVLKEKGSTLNQLELKIKDETGRSPNLYITKNKKRLPKVFVYPYLKEFLNDDEMYDLTLKKMDSAEVGGKAFDLLDEILYSLEPSEECLYKQRLKRRMQREAMKWYYTNTHGKLIAQNIHGQQLERSLTTWTKKSLLIII